MKEEIITLIKSINKDFDLYLKDQLKNRNIPIKFRHAGIFATLYERKDRIEFKDLVKEWNRSKSTLSETVNKYVEKGLLKKETPSIDKRVVYISLTETGKSYSEGFKGIYKDYSIKIVKSLRGDHKMFLKDIISDLVDDIENRA